MQRADSGHTGKALRLDFDFQGHGGYAVIHRALPIDFPDNYVLSFWIRGNAPVNNLEFKLIDATGDNVWWRNQRGFTFQGGWRKVTIRKRQIEFAWGPIGGGELKHAAALEFAITAGSGGKGTVWLDDLRLEPREPERPYDLTPVASASRSLAGYPASNAIDPDTGTGLARLLRHRSLARARLREAAGVRRAHHLLGTAPLFHPVPGRAV
jgi:hypothetical protein